MATIAFVVEHATIICATKNKDKGLRDFGDKLHVLSFHDPFFFGWLNLQLHFNGLWNRLVFCPQCCSNIRRCQKWHVIAYNLEI